MGRKTFPNYRQTTSPMKVKTQVLTHAEILKIKDEATQKAVEILEKKYDAEALRTEGYLEAIDDANKYFILAGCKALNEQFGFGKERLWRFISAVAELEVDTQDGTSDLEQLEKWLDEKQGIKLVASEIEDEIKQRQEKKSMDSVKE